MAITLTAIHKKRIADQVIQNLLNLQRAMVRNANAHKAMALAQNPPLVTLRAFVVDSAATYLGNLQWVIDLRANPPKRQRLLDAIASQGISESEIVSMVTELRAAAVALRDAPKGSYAAIAAACDAVLATVDPLDSLWPE